MREGDIGRQARHQTRHERWAELRFSIIGSLLASPPLRGQLAAELARLADREWLHRKSAEPVRLAVSTLERWYYTARNAPDPVAALARSPRKDRGRVRAVTSALGAVVRKQWSEHPSWSYQLHRDNLAVEVAERPELGGTALGRGSRERTRGGGMKPAVMSKVGRGWELAWNLGEANGVRVRTMCPDLESRELGSSPELR